MKNIKKIPKFWKYVPFMDSILETKMASTIYSTIYLTEEDYNDLISPSPSVRVRSIVVHEECHVKQWKEIGLIKFGVLYFFSKKFRLEQELLAIGGQMKFLKKHNETYDIERKAKHFSGKDYGHLLKIEDARRMLTILWQTV